MLDLIDRLPRHTYYWQVITQDPEHAEMLVQAQESAEREGKTSSAPPMSTWSPEVEALARIEDKVASLLYVTRAVGGDKSGQPPKPSTRPRTLIDKIKGQRRLERHTSLADRLLGR